MRRSRLSRGAAAAAILCLWGCTPIRIRHVRDEAPARDDTGTLVLKALRGRDPERLASDYAFSVSGTGLDTTVTSSSDAPSVLPGLKGGMYDISVSGKKVSSQKARVCVRPGEQTVVELRVRKARAASQAEDFAVVTAKTPLYLLAALFYLPIAALCGELGDDDCDEITVFTGDARPSCSHPSGPGPAGGRKPPKEDKQSPPQDTRVRSLLKEEK
jgi:hypothetical protein